MISFTSGTNYSSALKSRAYVIILLTSILIFCTACQTQSSAGTVSTKANSPIRDAGSNSAESKPIKIASGEWIPYTGKQLPGYGCDSRVVTEILNKMGYTIEFGFFPWARAYHLARVGEWDGTMEWDDTSEHRADFYLSSETLSDQEWVFFYHKDRPFAWESVDDLSGKTIGVTSGYVYSNAFKEVENSGKINFEEASNDEANFSKLLAGRIDIFPMEKNVGNMLLNEYFSESEREKITFHPKPLHTFSSYLLLTKTNPNNAVVMQKFSEELITFKQSQPYAEIMQDCVP